MFRRRGELSGERRRLADLVTLAFALLALGDTGHVGFRVWAYALGGLESQVTVLGRAISLVGAGALATAVTVTLVLHDHARSVAGALPPALWQF